MVVLSEVEMSREPSLDASVLPDELDELAALGVVGMVEPAASVDDVVLLEHAEAAAVGRGVGEYEDLPPLVGRVVLEGLLEPLALLPVDGDLVAGVLGVPEDGGGESDEEGLVGDLSDEVGAGLGVGPQEQVEILGVGGELVDALKVVVAADDLVGDAEGSEEVGGRLVADGRAGEQLAGLAGLWSQFLDSPRSPREQRATLPWASLASLRMGSHWARPVS